MMFVIVFWCFKVCCIVIPSSPAWSVSVIAFLFICRVILFIDFAG